MELWNREAEGWKDTRHMLLLAAAGWRIVLDSAVDMET